MGLGLEGLSSNPTHKKRSSHNSATAQHIITYDFMCVIFLKPSPSEVYEHYHHFTDEETEGQSNYMSCP